MDRMKPKIQLLHNFSQGFPVPKSYWEAKWILREALKQVSNKSYSVSSPLGRRCEKNIL